MRSVACHDPPDHTVTTTHLPINVAWHVSLGPLQGCAVSSLMNTSIWMYRVISVLTLPWQPISGLDMFSWACFRQVTLS